MVIPIEMTPGQNLLNQIWKSELLIGHYSEIAEPVNAFGMQQNCNFKT